MLFLAVVQTGDQPQPEAKESEMSIETLRDRIDYLENEWAKEKAENAELKVLIGYCINDMYKSSGKISKPTAIKLMKYMSDNDLLKY